MATGLLRNYKFMDYAAPNILALRVAFVICGVMAYLIGFWPHWTAWSETGVAPDALVWNLTHYHVGYGEFGFLRRGFLGSLLSPVMSALTDGGAGEYALMLGIDVAVSLALLFAAMQVFLPVRGVLSSGQSFLAMALVLSPVGFMQMGYDAARLDHVNFLLAILAMLAIRAHIMALAGLLLAIAVLIHEASLFYALPVAVAYAGKIRGTLAMAAVAVPTLIAAACLFFLGGVDVDMSLALPAEANLAASVWTRDLLEPARGFPPLHYLIAAYFAAIPLFLLTRHYKLNGLRVDLLLLAPSAGIALFALGVDYGRWGHCITFSVLMVIAVGLDLGRRPGIDLTPGWTRAALLPWLIPAGPLGIALLYPFIPFIV